jgi:hypothetical protein
MLDFVKRRVSWLLQCLIDEFIRSCLINFIKILHHRVQVKSHITHAAQLIINVKSSS